MPPAARLTPLALVGALLALCVATPAHAQLEAAAPEREHARDLALQGMDLFKGGSYQEALDSLREAERLFHAPTHLLFIARSEAALGKLVAAHATYMGLATEEIPGYAPEAFHRARAAAREELAALEPKVARLLVEVTGSKRAQASVTIDGEPLEAAQLAHPIAVEPGERVIKATAEGTFAAVAHAQAKVGELTRVAIALRRASPTRPPPPLPQSLPREPPEPPLPVPLASIVAFGIGGAAFIAGGITGGVTLALADDIKDQCRSDTCPTSQESAADDAKAIGHVSTAMFVVAGAAAASGLVLFFVLRDDGDGGDETGVELRPGPAGASARVRF
jgi:hypothetical protein